MSAFPDTGPQPDGTRTAGQWMAAMGEDVALIRSYLQQSLKDGADKKLMIAAAQKEARRLTSDIRRFADEVHGISQQDVDAVGPL